MQNKSNPLAPFRPPYWSDLLPGPTPSRQPTLMIDRQTSTDELWDLFGRQSNLLKTLEHNVIFSTNDSNSLPEALAQHHTDYRPKDVEKGGVTEHDTADAERKGALYRPVQHGVKFAVVLGELGMAGTDQANDALFLRFLVFQDGMHGIPDRLDDLAARDCGKVLLARVEENDASSRWIFDFWQHRDKAALHGWLASLK